MQGSLLLAWAWLLVGCAASGTSPPARIEGRSGPVTWRVVDIEQVVAPDRRSIDWSYVLILEEVSGTTVSFEYVVSSAESRRHTDTLHAAPVRRPFEHTLTPGGTLRVPLHYGIFFTSTAAPSFDQNVPGGHEGVVRSHRLVGRTVAGAPVSVDVRFPLDQATGVEKRRDGPGLTGRYQGPFSLHWGTWQGRRTWDLRARLSQTGPEVAGEVATRDQSQHGSFRGTVAGDRLSASLRLGDLRCDVTATVSDEGHNLAGQFQCGTGEVGSLVLNRW